VGSVLLLGGIALFWSQQGPTASDPPAVALPGPWEPPTAPAGSASPPVFDNPPGSVPPSSAGGPAPATRDRTTPPATRPTRAPTTSPTTSRPIGPNLSIGAESDGSSKADGTSFGDVRDGDLSTFWSPTGSTGDVSIKRSAPFTVSRIIIRETSGGGAIRSWRVLNHDSGRVLATGTAARVITFSRTSLRKITFQILSASGSPRVAEFQTFAG
jgi:hypothetical protein